MSNHYPISSGRRIRASLCILMQGDPLEISEHLRGAFAAYVLANLQSMADCFSTQA